MEATLKTTQKNISITLYEHDIDLLLLEEFYTSDKFVEWFTEKIKKPGAKLVHCTNSSTSSNGESDLVLTFQNGTRELVVFIEDKIDAPLQPDQAKRYKERANSITRKQNCDALTVIAAPEKYFKTDDNKFEFDYKITYEEIDSWFEDSEDSQSLRVDFKRKYIHRAIGKSIQGWVMTPDEAVTDFWKRYWEKATALAPELQMKNPNDKPAGSRTIYFKPWSGKNVKIVHQVFGGYVDLRFVEEYDNDANYQAFTNEYKQKNLPSDAFITRTGKEAAIRIDVTSINIKDDFSSSVDAVEEAICAAKTLFDFYQNVDK